MYKPGDVVQTYQISTTIQTDNATTSFIATNVTATLQLTTAANMVNVKYSGSVRDAGNAGLAIVALFRGTAAVTMQVGPYLGHIPSSNAEGIAPISAEWLDLPNSTTGSYTAGVRNNGAGVTASFPYTGNSNIGTMKLEEIMC